MSLLPELKNHASIIRKINIKKSIKPALQKKVFNQERKAEHDHMNTRFSIPATLYLKISRFNLVLL